MILDYAKPDSRWKRLYGRRRLLFKILLAAFMGWTLINLLLSGMEHRRLVNFEQHLFREEHAYFGYVTYRQDAPYPGYSASTTLPGTWRIRDSVRPYGMQSAASGMEGVSVQRLQNVLDALKLSTNLSAAEKAKLADEAWSAAAKGDFHSLNVIINKSGGLQTEVERMSSTVTIYPTTRQAP